MAASDVYSGDIIPPYNGKLTFDKSLSFSKDDFLAYLKSRTRKETRTKEIQLDSVIAFPEPYILAQFATKAYNGKKNKETEAEFEERLQLPHGWKLLTTAKSKAFLNMTWGYFGAAFWHPARRRIVIAHRGTDIKNLDALRADLRGIIANKYVKQMNAACTFSHKLYEAICSVEKDYNVKFQIYFTGHSLGGWLAQVTTFSLKYLKLQDRVFFKIRNDVDIDAIYQGYHAHTEVFDSPGCRDMLLQMAKDFDVRYTGKTTEVDRLDITTYLSSPNFVNCCNLHVGKLYRIFPEIKTEDYVSYTLCSHGTEGILETLENPSSVEMKEVVDWPKIDVDLWNCCTFWKIPKLHLGKEYASFFDWAKKINKFDPKADDMTINLTLTDVTNSEERKVILVHYQTKPVGKNECLNSVFTDLELKFLQRFQQLKIIPNKIFDKNKISDEYQTKIMSKLQTLRLQGGIVTCEANSDIRQLVPYVKALLRLYPDLSKQAEDALTDFEVRKQIYENIDDKYRSQIKDLTKLMDEDSKVSWVALMNFFESKADQVCHIQALYGTDIAMAKALATVPNSPRSSLIFAFELQNILTTEIFFNLKEFIKHEKLPETTILIECAGELRSNPERVKFIQDLRDEITLKSNIKLVIITDGNNHDLNLNYVIKHDGIMWGELTNEAQKEIIKKNLIEFQGKEKLSLEHFFRAADLSQFEVLDPITLVKLIRNEVITAGKELESLDDVIDYYISREFELKVVLDEKLLLNISSDELIAINDQRFGNQENAVQITNSDDFQCLCEENPNRNIHWLKSKSNSKLIWYKSRGRLDYLRQYVDEKSSFRCSEDSLLDRFDKSLIISDTPGMGKTTVLSVLGQKLKSKYSNYWVIKINLNACTKALGKANIKEISFENHAKLSTFMLKYILPCSENTTLKTPFEEKCFENSLTNYGGLVLIFDGFDEISPSYECAILTMLRALITTRVEKIIISTRPHTKEQLENCLSTWAHSMVPFSKEDQENFIVNFLKKHMNTLNMTVPETIGNLKEYALKSIDNLSNSINDNERQLMGVPLQCRLLASYMLRKISNGQFEIIHNVSLMDLYKDFIEGKIEIYDSEKCRNSYGNIPTEFEKKYMKTGILNKHRQYALQLLLSKNVFEELNYPELEDDEGLVEISLLKVGLVYKIGENTTFIHRTFAEYFLVDYLLHLAINRNRTDAARAKMSILTREVMLKTEFAVIRTFLDVLIRNDKNSEETANILRSYVEFLDTNWSQKQAVCCNTAQETVLHVLLREKQLHIFISLMNILSTYEQSEPEDEQNLLLSVVQHQDRRGKTALYVAVWIGDFDTVKLLVRHGADVNVCPEGGYSPLYLACQFGYTEIVKILLDAGSDINARSLNEWSPLLIASLRGHTQLVELLLLKGAKVDARTDIGWTSIHLASQNNHTEIVQLLINAGADVNCETYEKWTPLHLVSFYGHLEIAELLIENRAVVNTLNDMEFIPLHYACDKNHLEIVRLLLDNGADFDAITGNDPPLCHSDTSMHIAAQEGHINVVKLLLERGAKHALKNSHDETPLDRAEFFKHNDVVELLRRHESVENVTD